MVCRQVGYKKINRHDLWDGLFLWSWRDSNPRPNKQYISFLHAYSTIGFRLEAEGRHPTSSLSSEIFEL